MADQCYFNGDFYQCINATSDSPADDPESWVKIKLPGKWRWALAQLTYANLLRLDGQTDKAAVERSLAYGRERHGLDDLIRQEANEEQRFTSARGRMARVNTGRTRPVKASVILDDAYRLIGWDADQLDDREKQDARMALSQSLQEVWEAWWWQELMLCEQTRFAAAFSEQLVLGDGYQRGTAVYWPQEDWYYVAAANDTTTDPTNAAGTEDRFWVEYETSPTAPAAWDSTTEYTYGDKVSYAGKYFKAMDSSFSDEPPPVAGGSTDYWSEYGTWQPMLPYETLETGVYAGPFGPIRSVSKYDPRTASNPQPFELDVTADGTRVIGLTVAAPWVWSRRVTPVLTGDDFDPDTSYTSVDPQDLVFDSTDSTGVFGGGSGIFANP